MSEDKELIEILKSIFNISEEEINISEEERKNVKSFEMMSEENPTQVKITRDIKKYKKIIIENKDKTLLKIHFIMEIFGTKRANYEYIGNNALFKTITDGNTYYNKPIEIFKDKIFEFYNCEVDMKSEFGSNQNELNFAEFKFSECKIMNFNLKDSKFDFLRFENCEFVETINFNNLEFKALEFAKNTFLKKATFDNFESSESICMFSNATFKEGVDFANIKFNSFNNVKIMNLANFKSVKFLGRFTFCNEIFECDYIYFDNTIFNECYVMSDFFEKKSAEFVECEFEKDMDFSHRTFAKSVYFNGSIFKENVNFRACKFNESAKNGEVYFKNCKYEKEVNFSNSKFMENVYFNNSHFKSYADFHECEFEKTACFYGVKFDKVPNFSACHFKEVRATNFINVDIEKLDFQSVEKYIKDNVENKPNNDDLLENLKDKIRYSQSIRDSFRTIKDALVGKNDILEAQSWHKLELYAKEIELKNQLELKENLKRKNIKKIQSQEQKYNKNDYKKINRQQFFSWFKYPTFIDNMVSSIIAPIIVLPLILIYIIWKFAIRKTLSAFYILVVLFCYSILPLTFNKFIVFWKRYFEIQIYKLSKFGKNMLDLTT